MHAKLDELVGSVQTKCRRESLLYSGVIVSSQLPQLLGLLHDVIASPVVTEADLRLMSTVFAYEVQELQNRPEELVTELVHGPAFYPSDETGSAGMMSNWNSLLGVQADLAVCTPARVLDWWHQMSMPARMIIVGTGMPSGDLYNAAMDTFGLLERRGHSSPGPSQSNSHQLPSQPSSHQSGGGGEGDQSVISYRGGSNYVENEECPLLHVAIGFQGCAASAEQAFPLAILHMLMGGGSSFSAGGPGKGMYSRLYTQVLNRHHWIESCRIFDAFYRHTGLFGIQGSALPSHARDLVEVLLGQMRAMCDPLTPAELTRAKNQVKSNLLMGLESRALELEDLADQVSYLGEKYRSPRELCERIDQVSGEELQAAARELLASKPTVVAYGSLHRMPSYENILRWHRSPK